MNPPHFSRMPMHESILVSDEPQPITLYHMIVWIYHQALVANNFFSAIAQHIPQDSQHQKHNCLCKSEKKNQIIKQIHKWIPKENYVRK